MANVEDLQIKNNVPMVKLEMEESMKVDVVPLKISCHGTGGTGGTGVEKAHAESQNEHPSSKKRGADGSLFGPASKNKTHSGGNGARQMGPSTQRQRKRVGVSSGLNPNPANCAVGTEFGFNGGFGKDAVPAVGADELPLQDVEPALGTVSVLESFDGLGDFGRSWEDPALEADPPLEAAEAPMETGEPQTHEVDKKDMKLLVKGVEIRNLKEENDALKLAKAKESALRLASDILISGKEKILTRNDREIARLNTECDAGLNVFKEEMKRKNTEIEQQLEELKKLQEELNETTAQKKEALKQIANEMFPDKANMYSSQPIDCPRTCDATLKNAFELARHAPRHRSVDHPNDRCLEEEYCQLYREFLEKCELLRFPYYFEDGNGEKREAEPPNHTRVAHKEINNFCSDSCKLYHENEASAVAKFLSGKISRSQYSAVLIEAALLRSLHGLVIYGWLDTGHAKSIIYVLYKSMLTKSELEDFERERERERREMEEGKKVKRTKTDGCSFGVRFC